MVERIRWVRPSEREFTVEAVLEPAVAVESFTAKERVDISTKYSAGSVASPESGLPGQLLMNAVQQSLWPQTPSQAAPGCDILQGVGHFQLESQ